ncbi:hypothetical protein FRC00_007525, partial [Tulasnella sp. 408]
DCTCHQFIRSIQQYAIEAEMQRNDDWMADHASVRFDGEALIWFQGLDDEIQTNWRQLRRAILAQYGPAADEENAPFQPDRGHQPPPLEFKGESETECQEFVRRIRQRAVAEGRDHDSEWMVRLAYPCFSGNALRWHASLPIDVQSNWRSLERAILLDYPHRPTSITSPAHIQVNDWYSFAPPPTSLQSIRTHTDWINQARERRRLYEACNDKALPCWFLIESERDIPDNAIRTGTDVSGTPLFSARSWYNDVGLVVGKSGFHLPGGFIALNSEEVGNITPYEILVGDPSHFKWVAVPEKQVDYRAISPSSFAAVEAGFENAHRHRATFISQMWLDDTWQPGKAHS